jgi:general secretion pathway protein G
MLWADPVGIDHRLRLASSRTSASRSESAAWGMRGFTLIELIVATTILSILVGMAVPLARVSLRREKERELRDSLWQIRDAIDRYKAAADGGAFQIGLMSFGYPPDLDVLVKGVDVKGKKLRFLRSVPLDPMTGKADWGLRSLQDDPDSESWGGNNVFDVYSQSNGIGFDGVPYKQW